MENDFEANVQLRNEGTYFKDVPGEMELIVSVELTGVQSTGMALRREGKTIAEQYYFFGDGMFRDELDQRQGALLEYAGDIDQSRAIPQQQRLRLRSFMDILGDELEAHTATRRGLQQ